MTKKKGLCFTRKAFKSQGFVQTGAYRPFILAKIVIRGNILKHNSYQDLQGTSLLHSNGAHMYDVFTASELC